MKDEIGYTTLNRLSGINGGGILPYRLQNSGTKVLISPPLVPYICSRKAVRLAAVSGHRVFAARQVDVAGESSAWVRRES